MAKDKYSALWVSQSSLRQFEACPRAYFLANVYKDPVTNHKMRIVSPPLALGQAVHTVLEELSVLPTTERFKKSLVLRLEEVWEKVSGKKGGFLSKEDEYLYKSRAQEMLRRVMDHPGPLSRPAVKIQQDLPFYWLSEDDNIVLCGKIDWLEYLPEKDSVHIIDFKTGRNEESAGSLQLPVYNLLATNCQKRSVEKLSYWYLERGGEPLKQPTLDIEGAHRLVLELAKKVKLHRQLNKLNCPEGGCNSCEPFERVLKGEGEQVGLDEYRNAIYILPQAEIKEEEVLL